MRVALPCCDAKVRAGVLLVAGALLALGAASGCSSDPPLRLEVGDGTVLVDDTDPVVVTGAEPGGRVTLTASAEDADGVQWTSRATFDADDRGRVDTGDAVPVSGDYEGAWATGLLFSLRADPSLPSYGAPDGTMALEYRATQDGRDDARATQRRTSRPEGLTVSETDLDDDGIVGTYLEPATPSGTAVLVLGGSEGGAPVGSAAGLAMHDHPSLALAYFGAPGLPGALRDVPVEYVGTALRWLAARPGVDRVVVEAVSRGTELAVLAARHYPRLVDGLVLGSPTSFVNTSLPDTDGAPFTWRGRPVSHAPFADFGEVAPQDPAAELPVARVRAPVLMVCGDDDHLWPSCASSRRIVERSPGLPRTIVTEPDAGHLVDFLVPGIPISSGSASSAGSGGVVLDVGGTQQADAVGRLDAWPQVLAFLDRLE